MTEAQAETDRQCEETREEVDCAVFPVEPDHTQDTPGAKEGFHAGQCAGQREVVERGESTNEVVGARFARSKGQEVRAYVSEIRKALRCRVCTQDHARIPVDGVDAVGKWRQCTCESPQATADVERTRAGTRYGAKQDLVIA
jgi:hypothetical protein